MHTMSMQRTDFHMTFFVILKTKACIQYPYHGLSFIELFCHFKKTKTCIQCLCNALIFIWSLGYFKSSNACMQCPYLALKTISMDFLINSSHQIHACNNCYAMHWFVWDISSHFKETKSCIHCMKISYFKAIKACMQCP